MNQMENERRQILAAAATTLITGILAGSAPGQESSDESGQERSSVGKPGDFDFLTGEWKIRNRRKMSADSDQWDEFDGEATCWSILSGNGSIEELRIPDRQFFGMGLRLLNVNDRIWNDYWVNARSGMLTTPGQTGVFQNGVGTFTADDRDGERPIKVRGVWDKISFGACRWSQAVSYDQGATWKENWVMEWTRST